MIFSMEEELTYIAASYRNYTDKASYGIEHNPNIGGLNFAKARKRKADGKLFC